MKKNKHNRNTGLGEKKSNLLLIASEILLQCMKKIIGLSVDKMKT